MPFSQPQQAILDQYSQKQKIINQKIEEDLTEVKKRNEATQQEQAFVAQKLLSIEQLQEISEVEERINNLKDFINQFSKNEPSLCVDYQNLIWSLNYFKSNVIDEIKTGKSDDLEDRKKTLNALDTAVTTTFNIETSLKEKHDAIHEFRCHARGGRGSEIMGMAITVVTALLITVGAAFAVAAFPLGIAATITLGIIAPLFASFGIIGAGAALFTHKNENRGKSLAENLDTLAKARTNRYGTLFYREKSVRKQDTTITNYLSPALVR